MMVQFQGLSVNCGYVVFYCGSNLFRHGFFGTLNLWLLSVVMFTTVLSEHAMLSCCVMLSVMYIILWYSINISLMKEAPFDLLFCYLHIGCIPMILMSLLFELLFLAGWFSMINYNLLHSCLCFLLCVFYCCCIGFLLLADWLCSIYLYIHLSEY